MLIEQTQVTVDAVTDKLLGEHRRWIEQFAAKDHRSYDTVMEAARRYLETGDIINTWDEFDYEFWEHYQVVIGKEVPPDARGDFFVCCGGNG